MGRSSRKKRRRSKADPGPKKPASVTYDCYDFADDDGLGSEDDAVVNLQALDEQQDIREQEVRPVLEATCRR